MDKNQFEHPENLPKSELEEEMTIEKARNFGELYQAIRQMEGLMGSHKYYSDIALIDIIEKVRNGKLGRFEITRTAGLRDKVEELIKLESKK